MSDITVDIKTSYEIKTIISQLQSWTKLVLDYIHIDSSSIHVMIVDNEEGEYYNIVYRKKAGPTNVLSFPENNHSGMIVLCHPVIIHESQALKKTLEERYFQVYCHGILHLCEYTHDFDDDTIVMESIEENLFEIFKKNKS